LIYEYLFCDNIKLLKSNTQQPWAYPWNTLFADTASPADLEKVADDNSVESRVKLLAYNMLLGTGHKSTKKELLGVIVEVGLEQGMDVLASYKDGSARYINQSGKMIFWDAPSAASNALTAQLFERSQIVVDKIGPWNQPRRPKPAKGTLRISFLVSDGLYFGEAPVQTLFNDPLSGPALASATALMKFLMETVLNRPK
jgi:hypothetical protein